MQIFSCGATLCFIARDLPSWNHRHTLRYANFVINNHKRDDKIPHRKKKTIYEGKFRCTISIKYNKLTTFGSRSNAYTTKRTMEFLTTDF